jgi:hypothetical protein
MPTFLVVAPYGMSDGWLVALPDIFVTNWFLTGSIDKSWISNGQFRHQRSELMKSTRAPAKARVINSIEKMPPMAYR